MEITLVNLSKMHPLCRSCWKGGDCDVKSILPECIFEEEHPRPYEREKDETE